MDMSFIWDLLDSLQGRQPQQNIGQDMTQAFTGSQSPAVGNPFMNFLQSTMLQYQNNPQRHSSPFTFPGEQGAEPAPSAPQMPQIPFGRRSFNPPDSPDYQANNNIFKQLGMISPISGQNEAPRALPQQNQTI